MFLFVCICCGLVASSLAAVDVEQFSGCRAIRSPCCEGKDNTCIGEGPRLNDVNSTSCFCDTACIELGDCCLDYADTCPVVDCELSDDWGEWSDCDVRCGTGTKTRSRIVLKSALNGGKPCESHVQKTSCEGAKCKQARAGEGHNELKERGRIIPAVFGSWRSNKKYDPFQDIRKNLFEHYGHPGLVQRPPYCAKFEIVDIHGACKTAKMSSKWSKNLSRGAALCVECQTFSMKKELGGRCRGHGVYNKVTEWKAVTVPGCHGKWKMTSRHEDGCQCDPNSDLSFVLV